jgi:hypothetical protein
VRHLKRFNVSCADDVLYNSYNIANVLLTYYGKLRLWFEIIQQQSRRRNQYKELRKINPNRHYTKGKLNQMNVRQLNYLMKHLHIGQPSIQKSEKIEQVLRKQTSNQNFKYLRFIEHNMILSLAQTTINIGGKSIHCQYVASNSQQIKRFYLALGVFHSNKAI